MPLCCRESGLQVAGVRKVWGKEGLLKAPSTDRHTDTETRHFKEDVMCYCSLIYQEIILSMCKILFSMCQCFYLNSYCQTVKFSLQKIQIFLSDTNKQTHIRMCVCVCVCARACVHAYMYNSLASCISHNTT